MSSASLPRNFAESQIPLFFSWVWPAGDFLSGSGPLSETQVLHSLLSGTRGGAEAERCRCGGHG